MIYNMLTCYDMKQVGPTPESNSILKCILGPKRFWVKIFVSSKILGQKIFGSQKILGPNNFSIQKIVVQKILGPQIFWVRMQSWVRKKYRVKK